MYFKLYTKSNRRKIDKPSEAVLLVEKEMSSFNFGTIRPICEQVAENCKLLHDANASIIRDKLAKIKNKDDSKTISLHAFSERSYPSVFLRGDEAKDHNRTTDERGRGFRNNIGALAFHTERIAREPDELTKAIRDALNWCRRQRDKTVNVIIDDERGEFAAAFVSVFVRELRCEFYDFSPFKSDGADADPHKISYVVIHANARDESKVEEAFAQALVLADSMDLVRDLGNMPANVMTPKRLAKAAKRAIDTLVERARQESGGADNPAQDIKVEIFNKKGIAKLGMNSFLSVAKGSEEAPRLIQLTYKGPGRDKPRICLVGKGITFDSGGISLKPPANMDEMKYDMMGGASVIATFAAACRLRLPIDLRIIVPACENMPSGGANKPGDIVKSMSGQTIEILNTDAEGRLILCDALTLADKFDPDVVVDVATLTGACVIALGSVASGVFCDDDELAQTLVRCGKETGDKCWRMPMYDEYEEQLRSNFADVANVGGRPAGSSTAAVFLREFAGDWRWAHLDIAGTAWRSGKKKGATGRPVPLLLEFLKSVAASPERS